LTLSSIKEGGMMKTYQRIGLGLVGLGIVLIVIGMSLFLLERHVQAQSQSKSEQANSSKKEKVAPEDTLKAKEEQKQREQHEEINKRMIEKAIKREKPYIQAHIKGLKDSDPDVRSRCIERLQRGLVREAIGPLIEILRSDSVMAIRGEAASALGQLGYYWKDNRVLPALREALKDRMFPVQLVAARELIHLGDTSSPIPALVSIFRKEPEIFRKPSEVWVKEIVVRPDLPDTEQIRIAEEARKDGPILALKWLVNIGSKEVIEALTPILNNQDEWVRTESRKAIEKIREKMREVRK